MDVMEQVMSAIDELMTGAEGEQDTAMADALAGLATQVSACMEANPTSEECQALADKMLALLEALIAPEVA